MPFFVIQFQSVGYRAVMRHYDTREPRRWSDFRAAQEFAVENSGWDGDCRVFHFASDEDAEAFASHRDQLT